MSLLMLLIARAYAPLGARGALVEGLACRTPAAAGEAALRSPAPCATFSAQSRWPAHTRGTHARDERESLAA